MTAWIDNPFNHNRNEKKWNQAFAHLESYWKNLILNASALLPFDSPAASP